MKDIKIEVGEFIQKFQSVEEIEEIRTALNIVIGQNKEIALETIKQVQSVLNSWFKRKLYSLGRIVKEVKTLADSSDYGYELGLGYSVEAKKDKINIGRYLLHLILIIESNERQIKNLKDEVKYSKQTYLDMENAISDLINNPTTPQDIQNKLDKFYWLKD